PLLLAAVMVIASMPCAYCGALVARRTPSKWLKLLLAGILVATSVRLLVFESPIPGPFSFGPEQAALGLLIGFCLGIISGLLGVAGRGHRIHAVVSRCGFPA